MSVKAITKPTYLPFRKCKFTNLYHSLPRFSSFFISHFDLVFVAITGSVIFSRLIPRLLENLG